MFLKMTQKIISVHISFHPLYVTVPFHTRKTDQTENDQDTNIIEVEDVQLSDTSDDHFYGSYNSDDTQENLELTPPRAKKRY